MSSRSKKQKNKKPKGTNHRAETPEQNLNNVVSDTAATFTCAFKTAGDFQSQCQRRVDDLETDLVFARLALEIWQDPDRDPRTTGLAAMLRDFVVETQRQVDALVELEQRLAPLATDETFHIHLDPPEPYRELIRKRITADTASRTEAE